MGRRKRLRRQAVIEGREKPRAAPKKEPISQAEAMRRAIGIGLRGRLILREDKDK